MRLPEKGPGDLRKGCGKRLYHRGSSKETVTVKSRIVGPGEKRNQSTINSTKSDSKASIALKAKLRE